jgi:polyhydroxybutyrate depolymerase
MMKRSRQLILVSAFVLALGVLLVAAQQVKPDSANEALSQTIQVGALQREYILHIPAKLDKNKPLPVVFVFHGGGGSAIREAKSSGFAALAQRERFLVVYPQGIGQNWNDGRVTTVSQAHRDGVDDLAFFDAMLASMAKEYAIDNKRVYATGLSNGAIFSHYLGANRADRIAAIAPVAGGIADPFHKDFKPSEPVSVLIIQGTKDPIMPYEGGEIALRGGKARGRIIGTDETIELWNRNNGSATEPNGVELPDRDPKDGCRVKQYRWLQKSTEVQLLRLDGGGHTWPGGAQSLSSRIVGPVCQDFDATTVIWAFFKAQAKP